MDLFSAEAKKIKALVQDWINRPEQELEATFGLNGTVDSNTFLQIAQRLRTKGFEPIPQDDRLSILTPNHVRLSLQGLGVLRKYCEDDKLTGTPFTAIIKDRTSQDSTIDIEEYNVRIKSRREIPLSRNDERVKEIIDNWNFQKKAFRLIKRWTFKGNGMRIDLSMVRSTPKTPKGDFQYMKNFLDVNIFKQAPQYEVEVELLRDEYTSTVDSAVKVLISGVGEILRAIQKNTLLIRNSISNKVKSEYFTLVNSDKFRGVAPVTISIKNMSEDIEESIPNIRSGYNVTDKADGLRTLGFCNNKGELFLIDMAMNVYRTGMENIKCANSLLDGEWVTVSKDGKPINHFLIFDIYIASKNVNVTTLPFAEINNIDGGNGRYNSIKKWFNDWKDGVAINTKSVTEKNKLIVAVKQFQFATPNNKTIFTACSRVLDTTRIYNTDGLILTPNTLPLPQKPGETFYEQFKWKPSHDNTIDFLIKFEKDVSLSNVDKITTGIHPQTGETVRYKTLRLYVGSDKDPAFDNPRNTILDEQNIPYKKQQGTRYKPVLFNPLDFPDTMANTCNLLVEFDSETGEEYVITDVSREPIKDSSIIEMRYDPLKDSGWRWIPVRVRHDKTERLLKGIIAKTLNSEKVANSVWNSIHDPITESMIRTGNDEPTEDEIKALIKSRESDVSKKYYERKASEEDIMLIRGMLDFHNKYIKNNVIYKSLLKEGNKTVLDVACGKGGDLYKWIMGKARAVIGVDTAGENILNNKDGAYKRYLESIIEFGKNRVPVISFIIGDSSRSLINGEAGATPEERDMLRSIFGKFDPEGPVPSYIENNMAGIARAGVDIAVCMFALHYFFENSGTLNGILKNIKDSVKVGGYFAGCAFDGDKVFNLLKNTEYGHSKSGKEGDVPIWTITKNYNKEELISDESSIGLAIEVEFISIGTPHKEYLISFPYFEKKMKEIGFELLDSEESNKLGLRNSTNTFDVSYEMATKSGRKFVMPESVKQFSFLNRWFIFKRVEEKDNVDISEINKELNKVSSESAEKREERGEEKEIIKITEKEDKGATEREETGEGDVEGEVEEDKKDDSNIINTISSETGAKLPSPDKKFSDSEIYRFGPDALLQDRLKIRDIGAGRWIGLTGQFPIPDMEDSSIVYPTIEHFLAGMKLKYASNKPSLAKELMSNSGKIHQDYLIKRRSEGSIKPESARDYELLEQEIKEVRSKLTKTALNQYRTVIDDSKWVLVKDKIIEYALKYRWDHDSRFHNIIEEARNQGKYLLYGQKLGSSASELGGVRKADGKIEGENMIGKIIMTLAGFRF